MDDQTRTLLSLELQNPDLLKGLELIPDHYHEPKSVTESEKARLEGNKLYKKNHHTAQEHDEILRLYSKSIAYAPADSEELAKGYGNRSALLLHMGRHADCLSDIDRAAKITEDTDLLEKLAKRRCDCIKIIIQLKKKEAIEKNKCGLCDDNNDDNDHHHQSENAGFSLKLDDDFARFTLDECKVQELPLKDSRSSVAIRYNQKYGRHLAATRDIKPGEIIFVEKSYVNGFNTKKLHNYCGHCLAKTWSSIPCDNCGWFMYCSEECKKEAWEQYHDIECTCIAIIMFFAQQAKVEYSMNVGFDGLCIRAMVKGLRQAGSLKQFKIELKSVENSIDQRTRGFSENGKFESDKFRSLYSLSSDVSYLELESCIKFTVIAVTCLAKFSKFFGDLQFTTIEDLFKKSNVMFFASLILNLTKISCINSHSVINITDLCRYSHDPVTCRQSWCCVRGTCIVPIASLTNHSCNPNSRRCFTDDNKFILYALQPIKKNSQICDSYYCSFYEGKNPLRRGILKQNFNFECDCIACTSDWPCFSVFPDPSQKIFHDITLNDKELELWKKYENLIESIDKDIAKYDKNLLQTICIAIEKSTSLIQPSIVTYKIIYSLIQVFEKLYGYKVWFQVLEDC